MVARSREWWLGQDKDGLVRRSGYRSREGRLVKRRVLVQEKDVLSGKGWLVKRRVSGQQKGG